MARTGFTGHSYNYKQKIKELTSGNRTDLSTTPPQAGRGYNPSQVKVKVKVKK